MEILFIVVVCILIMAALKKDDDVEVIEYDNFDESEEFYYKELTKKESENNEG
jgi:hypothetical protein